MQGAATSHLQQRRRAVASRLASRWALIFIAPQPPSPRKNFSCFKLGSCKLDSTRPASATHRFSGYLTPVYSPDM